MHILLFLVDNLSIICQNCFLLNVSLSRFYFFSVIYMKVLFMWRCPSKTARPRTSRTSQPSGPHSGTWIGESFIGKLSWDKRNINLKEIKRKKWWIRWIKTSVMKKSLVFNSLNCFFLPISPQGAKNKNLKFHLKSTSSCSICKENGLSWHSL